MVVNSCFEDLEGRVGDEDLMRVREFVPKAGKASFPISALLQRATGFPL